MAHRAGARRASPCSAFRTWRHATTHAEVKVPWLLGLIATRSIDKTGAGDLRPGRTAREAHRERHAGARGAAGAARQPRTDAAARSAFEAHQADLGYGLLLLRYVDNPATATAAADRARPPGPRCRTCRCCSGASASWWRSVCFSSCCSRRRSICRRGTALSRHRWFLRLSLCQPAAAVDRRGARLDRGRVRPPALGHRRRAADLPRRLDHARPPTCLVLAARASWSSTPRSPWSTSTSWCA